MKRGSSEMGLFTRKRTIFNSCNAFRIGLRALQGVMSKRKYNSWPETRIDKFTALKSQGLYIFVYNNLKLHYRCISEKRLSAIYDIFSDVCQCKMMYYMTCVSRWRRVRIHCSEPVILSKFCYAIQGQWISTAWSLETKWKKVERFHIVRN